MTAYRTGYAAAARKVAEGMPRAAVEGMERRTLATMRRKAVREATQAHEKAGSDRNNEATRAVWARHADAVLDEIQAADAWLRR